MNFSFVVPIYKDTMLTTQCLLSLRRFHPEGQVIVVDDGTPKGDLDVIKLQGICEKYRAELVLKDTNTGFANTVNTGINASKGDVIVLVNNDIIFTQNITKELETIFNTDCQVGIVGGLLEYAFGNVQHGGVSRIPGTIYFDHVDYRKPMCEARDAKESKYQIAVTGALFAIRKDMITNIGALSEKYGMAYEDVEYCLRAWCNGWRIFYSAEIRAIHAEGVSRGRTEQEKKDKGSWEAEKRSMAQYLIDIKKYNLDGIEHYIEGLNK